jgi:hypothetical protein
MKYSELITDGSMFLALRDECTNVFDINRRLPQYVFQQRLAHLYAFEHGFVMRRDFAVFLADIARRFEDRAVNYMTLVPDPIDYYYKCCGFYGLASFELPTLVDNYIKVMSKDGSVNSFSARGGDVGVIWGSSLQWGIFCDRKSWELCVMACNLMIDKPIMSMVNVMDAARLRRYVSNEYRDRPMVAQEFLEGLTKNYPTLG